MKSSSNAFPLIDDWRNQPASTMFHTEIRMIIHNLKMFFGAYM